MSRVLVTGAGGFIGRHTLLPLLAGGHEVHAVSSRRLSNGSPIGMQAPEQGASDLGREVRWHHADLLAPESARAFVHQVQPSHLLHLAWYTEPGVFWTALENLDWVQASLQLLRAFAEAEGRRAVIAGTCTEYAWDGSTHCVEDALAGAGDLADAGFATGAEAARAPTPLRPATLYGGAKHALHVIAERWAPLANVGLAWGRIFYVYGPHEHPARLVSSVARSLLSGEEARCTHGTQVRDYLYSPELGGAFAALLTSEVTGPVNLASGEPVRLADLVAAIAAAADRPELVRLGALAQRPGEPERLTADVRRLRDEVGWRPSIDVHEGAIRTVDWWRQALAVTTANGGPPAEAAGSLARRA